MLHCHKLGTFLLDKVFQKQLGLKVFFRKVILLHKLVFLKENSYQEEYVDI